MLKHVLNDSKVGSTRLILRTLKLEYTDVKRAHSVVQFIDIGVIGHIRVYVKVSEDLA